MTSAYVDGQATATGDLDLAVLTVSEATVWHRDLPARFNESAGLLRQAVRFSAPRAAPALPGRRFRVAPPVCFPARLVSLSPQLDTAPWFARRRIGDYCAGTASALGE
jgi:hypothetical protein